MRLIDADALRLMKVEECEGHTIDYAAGWKACIEWIKTLPTIDAVPGVYCKDCKHLDKASRFCFICMDWVKDTWFCRVGERRENDANNVE